MKAHKPSEHRILSVFLIAMALFAVWAWGEERIDWKKEWQSTVTKLEEQRKSEMATYFREKGPDSFQFKFFLMKKRFLIVSFIVLLLHYMMIQVETKIPNRVLAYRYIATTSRILPFIVTLAFLSAWVPWLNIRYAAEAASILDIDKMTPMEIRIHLGISRASGSIIHSVPILSKLSRLLLLKSTVEMYDQYHSVY